MRLCRIHFLGQIRKLDLRHVLPPRFHQELVGLQAKVCGLQGVRDATLPCPRISSHQTFEIPHPVPVLANRGQTLGFRRADS